MFLGSSPQQVLLKAPNSIGIFKRSWWERVASLNSKSH